MATTYDIKASTLEIKGRKKMKRKKKALPSQYKAPRGSAREKGLRKASALYKSGKKSAAFKLRNKMEKSYARKSKNKKTR